MSDHMSLLTHFREAAGRQAGSSGFCPHPKGPKVSAIVVVPHAEGGRDGLVMVKRQNRDGRVWLELPGGSQEPEDKGNPFHTAVRELYEEAGIAAIPAALAPEFNHTTPTGRPVLPCVCFQVGRSGPLNLAPDEHLGVRAVVPRDMTFFEAEGRVHVRTMWGEEVQGPVNLFRAMSLTT